MVSQTDNLEEQVIIVQTTQREMAQNRLLRLRRNGQETKDWQGDLLLFMHVLSWPRMQAM